MRRAEEGASSKSSNGSHSVHWGWGATTEARDEEKEKKEDVDEHVSRQQQLQAVVAHLRDA